MRKRAVILWLLSALIASYLSLGGAEGVEADEQQPQLLWTYQMGGNGEVAISPDGSYMAAGSIDGKVHFFSQSSSTPVWTYQTSSAITGAPAISTYGQYIAAGNTDGKVHFFSQSSSTPVWTYQTGGQVMTSICPNGDYVAARSYDGYLYLFYKSSSTPFWRYNFQTTFTEIEAMSADGSYFVATDGSKIFLFGKSDNIPYWSYQTSGTGTQTLAISADGDYIAVGSADGNVYLFQRENDIPQWNYSVGGTHVYIDISSDGNYVAAVSLDENKVYLFSRSSSTPLWTYQIEGAYRVSISSDGSRMAVGSHVAGDNAKLYYFSKSGTLLWNYQTISSMVLPSLSSDGRCLAGADYGGKLYSFSTINVPPILTSASISPSLGTSGTTFTYEVTYTDADSDAPSHVRISIDNALYPMTKISGTYQSGALYRLSIILTTDPPHTYLFETNDGAYTTWLPTNGSYSGPAIEALNTPPSLTSGSVSPSSGSPGATFTFGVTYTDIDDNAPSYIKVYIDNNGYDMTKISGDYTTGATYQYSWATTSGDGGSHDYYFMASDGTDAVRLPSDGDYSELAVAGPTLTSGSVSPSSASVGDTCTYEVTYTDPDAEAPSYLWVYIDGASHPMTVMGGTYLSGIIYRYTTSSLSAGSHTYYFSTSDGTHVARLPTSGTSSGPTVTQATEAFQTTITFYKSDGSALANTTIYYGTSAGQETTSLGTTDSNGQITSTSSALAGTTVYFKSSDGSYSGSTYISSSGGTVNAPLSTETPTVAPGAGFPLWVVAVIVAIVCIVGAGVALVVRKR